MEGAEVVHLHEVAHGVEVGLVEAAVVPEAGVGDDHVEPSGHGHGPGHERFDLRRVGDVARHGGGGAAGRRDVGRHAGELGLAPCGQHHVEALAGEGACAGLPDARGGARDHRGPAVGHPGHRTSPWMLSSAV
jgi:hypothetical protein